MSRELSNYYATKNVMFGMRKTICLGSLLKCPQLDFYAEKDKINNPQTDLCVL